MAETTDVNVDELRRRARRRLVGAIVLALAAAVFVPMLLESDRKPLGEDISVRIPPVDDGKFVNRLSATDAKDAGKAPAAKSATAGMPRETSKVEASRSETAKGDSPSRIDVAKSDASGSVGDGAPTTVAKEATRTETPGTVAAASPPPPAGTPKTDAVPDFSVQLAAFADDKGANALTNKLKKAGYSAYTEPLATSKGTLWRVRVGPFASRDAATVSRDKLKGEGYAGIVAPSR